MCAASTLKTIVLGRSYVKGAQLDRSMLAPFDAAFARLFLWYSIAPSKLPGRSWITATRVMRQYREEAAQLGIGLDPFDLLPGSRGDLLGRLYERLLSPGADHDVSPLTGQAHCAGLADSMTRCGYNCRLVS